MSKLVIDPTFKFPEIIFDPDKDIYSIKGQSFPENTSSAFEPVLDWIQNNIGEINKRIEFTFYVEYLNSASVRVFLEIFKRLELFHIAGADIQVNWHYDEDDNDMKEEGELYQSCVKLPFFLIPEEE